MTGLLLLLLLACGSALLAAARWCWRRYSARPLVAALAAGPLLAVGLGTLGYCVCWLLTSVEGLAAFLLNVALVLGLFSLLGYSLRIFPHRPLVFLLLAPGLASLAMFAAPETWLPLVVVDGLVALVALGDLGTLPKRRWFAASR
ncbi:MAG TPA: hypothetical protein VGX76_04070, partial [Pirellulales bacterium]|nr:hypothetical protein [Pirellulales bacterium]